jgi:hypothetical protein
VRTPRVTRPSSWPAAGATLLLLRLVWTPHIHTPVPNLGSERFRLIGFSLRYETGRWLAITALGGLTVAATFGALRPAGRTYLRRYGWVLPAVLLQPCWPNGRSSRWWAR